VEARDDAWRVVEASHRPGSLAPHEWDALAAKYDAEIREISAALADAITVAPLAQIVTSEDVRGMWERMTTARRRVTLGALVHRVDVLAVDKSRRVVTVEQAEGSCAHGLEELRAAREVSTARAQSHRSRPESPRARTMNLQPC
jgi:hypothetical protein